MSVRLSGVWDRQPVPLRMMMMMAQFWDRSQATWSQQHPTDTGLGGGIKLLGFLPCPGTWPSSWLGRTDRSKSE